jgi:hypothetical protein
MFFLSRTWTLSEGEKENLTHFSSRGAVKGIAKKLDKALK